MTDAAVDRARSVLAGRRVVALTGAGISTDSGIPDYRGPDSPPRKPMTYQQFVRDAAFRRHYWARNHVGHQRMKGTHPNAGHLSLSSLESSGVVTCVITQNVDTLHEKAGSNNVIDLHGRFDRVICLTCRRVITRQHLAERLEALNPGYAAAVGDAETAPDADAVIAETEGFVVADCEVCGGILKPDIVYFGENVPKERVDTAFGEIDAAAALLVAGSSLTVLSGYRFVRRASERGTPIVIVNRGPTRGDPVATVKVDGGCSSVLTHFARELPGYQVAAAPAVTHDDVPDAS